MTSVFVTPDLIRDPWIAGQARNDKMDVRGAARWIAAACGLAMTGIRCGLALTRVSRHCERSAAIHVRGAARWIATACGLAMTGVRPSLVIGVGDMNDGKINSAVLN